MKTPIGLVPTRVQIVGA